MLAALLLCLLLLLNNVFWFYFHASEMNITTQESIEIMLNMFFLNSVTKYKAWIELFAQNL